MTCFPAPLRQGVTCKAARLPACVPLQPACPPACYQPRACLPASLRLPCHACNTCFPRPLHYLQGCKAATRGTCKPARLQARAGASAATASTSPAPNDDKPRIPACTPASLRACKAARACAPKVLWPPASPRALQTQSPSASKGAKGRKLKVAKNWPGAARASMAPARRNAPARKVADNIRQAPNMKSQ